MPLVYLMECLAPPFKHSDAIVHTVTACCGPRREKITPTGTAVADYMQQLPRAESPAEGLRVCM